MKYCRNCGVEMQDGASICVKCGTSQNTHTQRVKINYDSTQKKVKIDIKGKAFDTSKIDGKDIADWVYPFIIKDIYWNGIYDELAEAIGEKEFTIIFDGDDSSFEVLKNALKNSPVKIAGMDNKVFILYKKQPLSTIITVNGRQFDTSKLQNRYIDEWLSPFQFRDVKWDGLFKELENFIGVDAYTIQFTGGQDDMKELMKNCPENVSITYKSPDAIPVKHSEPKRSFSHNSTSSPSVSQKTTQPVSQTAPAPEYTGQAKSVGTDNIQQFASDTINMMKQEISDEEINQNLNNIPIKNEFIRKNIMAICAAFSIIFGIFPFVRFASSVTATGEYAEFVESTGSTVQSFNLFSLISGEINSFFTIVLFIAPILLIVMNYIKQLRPYRRAIAIIFPAISFISEIILFFIIRSECISSVKASAGGGEDYFSMDVKVSVIPHIGFYLILLSYIITAIVGFITYYGLKLPIKKK